MQLNLIMMAIKYLKVNKKMEKEMDMEKNMLITKYYHMKENMKMEKGMESGKNMIVMVNFLKLNFKMEFKLTKKQIMILFVFLVIQNQIKIKIM